MPANDPFGRFCSAVVTGIVHAAMAARTAEHYAITDQDAITLTTTRIEQAPVKPASITIPGAALAGDTRLALKSATVDFWAPAPGKGWWNRGRHINVSLTLHEQPQLESFERVKDALNEQLDTQIQRSINNG